MRRRAALVARTSVVTALILGQAAPSLAQSPQTAADASTEAAARWREGVKAFAAGQFEAARVAFLQAYSLRAHPILLQNLGEAELRTAHYVDAVNHLSEFLDTNLGTATQRAKATASRRDALAHVGQLVITTNVDGASVRVDGEIVAKPSSLEHPFAVPPGSHLVALAKEGYRNAERTVDAPAGAVTNLAIDLAPITLAAAPPAPTTATSVVVDQRPLVAEKPSHPIPVRTVVLVLGGALTLAAVGTGTYFGIQYRADGHRIDDIHAALTPYNRSGPDSACASPATDAVYSACSELAQRIPARNNEATTATVAFISAGVLGAATLSALLLWPRRSDDVAVAAAPWASHESGGVTLMGRY